MELPELSLDPRASVDVVGSARSVAGRMLIVLPYAAPLSTNRGRRYRVASQGNRAVVRVVLSLTGHAALRPPDSTPLVEGQAVPLRLRAIPDRRPRRIPEDVRGALRAVGLSLDGIGEADVRHLLLMVDEAADPAIRAQRIQAAVAAAHQAVLTRS